VVQVDEVRVRDWESRVIPDLVLERERRRGERE